MMLLIISINVSNKVNENKRKDENRTFRVELF